MNTWEKVFLKHPNTMYYLKIYITDATFYTLKVLIAKSKIKQTIYPLLNQVVQLQKVSSGTFPDILMCSSEMQVCK